ncbi:hypothetical protein Bca52824_032450 [Brassica carinata]|uniref:Replication factor A C-terminal domain-containing protein n=1 Tax=Brassica carinata TaxID=52824 RepID=A0A8X7SB44_BRACI|nr:hypothetical protein Bca52824_032450 [Brassica carinata]
MQICGRCSSVVEARLLRFWEARNVKRGGELIYVDKNKILLWTVSGFTCGRCNNLHAVGALRYRVEMVISDNTAEGTLVWFDGVMTKLHSLRASEAVQMLVEDGVNLEDSRIPSFIAEMEGKMYTFQHHKTFTITRIAEEHGRLPADDVDNNGGNDDDDDDDDDDKPSEEPSPDEIGSEYAIGNASSAGGTGAASKARKKTDAGSSKVVKQARSG